MQMQKMECVDMHVGARRKESVATVGAPVTVIAAGGKYY
jgi:hypothetical protein